jgi:DNA-binding NarL/FixJ family response regulator
MDDETQPVRVLLVDDHQIVREGICMLLGAEPRIAVVGEAASGEEALRRVGGLEPDVVLLDLAMPGIGGLETLRRLRAERPEVAVLVLTTFAEEEAVRHALEAGARGYLLKDLSRAELVRAILDARQGRPALHPEAQRVLIQRLTAPPAPPSPLAGLTARERSILREIARGKSNKEIAKELQLTEGTVKGYVSIVLSKLGVEDRTQAALLAVRAGIEEG